MLVIEKCLAGGGGRKDCEGCPSCDLGVTVFEHKMSVESSHNCKVSLTEGI